MAQILGFVFAAASTVIALAMLLLVVWQAPRHRHNRLMAAYLATLVVWCATSLAARACALVGCSPVLFTYGVIAFNGINAFVLFWFVLLRAVFWGGRYRRWCGHYPTGVPPAFDEWHRRAHERMTTEPSGASSDANRSRG